MARKLILENLMKLAQSIGANPKNFMGTRTNITFLGKGPQRNPLFQGPVEGLGEEVRQPPPEALRAEEGPVAAQRELREPRSHALPRPLGVRVGLQREGELRD